MTRSNSTQAHTDGEAAVRAAIAALSAAARSLAERPHAVISSAVPQLSPTTWYGMPAAEDAKLAELVKKAVTA